MAFQVRALVEQLGVDLRRGLVLETLRVQRRQEGLLLAQTVVSSHLVAHPSLTQRGAPAVRCLSQ